MRRGELISLQPVPPELNQPVWCPFATFDLNVYGVRPGESPTGDQSEIGLRFRWENRPIFA